MLRGRPARQHSGVDAPQGNVMCAFGADCMIKPDDMPVFQ